MGKNLNQDLYRRFGLELELKTVQNGFRKYIKGILITLPSPDENVLMRICKRLFLDRESYEDQFDVYESTGDFKRLIRKEFDNFEGSFEEYILRLQILLEALYSSENFDRVFLDRLLYVIEEYFNDYHILGIKLKQYKTKPPQILPTVSEHFDKDVVNTLDLLETKKYTSVIEPFEEGLKEFLTAQSKSKLKNSVEDMYTACDETVKIVFGDKTKGFKHIFGKTEYLRLGLNGNQKEIYKSANNWMNGIKHGSIKDFDREDVEMIISLTAAFISLVVNKLAKLKEDVSGD